MTATVAQLNTRSERLGKIGGKKRAFLTSGSSVGTELPNADEFMGRLLCPEVRRRLFKKERQ